MDEHKLERLHRRIAARSGPQGVVCRAGKFDLIAADSPRLDAILNSPDWSGHVIGVFSPDVSIDVLRSEVAA